MAMLILSPLRDVQGLENLTERDLRDDSWMMRLRLMRCLFSAARLPSAKVLRRTIEELRARKKTLVTSKETASKVCHDQLVKLGCPMVGTQPRRFLEKASRDSFRQVLRFLLDYRDKRNTTKASVSESRRSGKYPRGGGELVMKKIEDEERMEKIRHLEGEVESLRSLTNRLIDESRQRVDAFSSLSEEEDSKTSAVRGRESDNAIETQRLWQVIRQQQLELRTQNAQLKRQLKMHRDALEAQGAVVDEVDAILCSIDRESNDEEARKGARALQRRLEGARRACTRAQNAKLLEGSRSEFRCRSRDHVARGRGGSFDRSSPFLRLDAVHDLSRSIQDVEVDLLHVFARAPPSSASAHLYKSQHNQPHIQFSNLAKRLRILMRRLGDLGLHLSSSSKEARPVVVGDNRLPRAADVLETLLREQEEGAKVNISCESKIRTDSFFVRTLRTRLRAHDVGARRVADVTRSEVETMRASRRLELAYTQRSISQLSAAVELPISRMGDIVDALDRLLDSHERCRAIAKRVASSASLPNVVVTILRGAPRSTLVEAISGNLVGLLSAIDTFVPSLVDPADALRQAHAEASRKISSLRARYEKERCKGGASGATRRGGGD